MFALHAFHGRLDDLAVLDVDLAVTVEVVHPTVPIIVDENVGGVTVHVATEARTPRGTAPSRVVLRRAKPTHYGGTVRRVTPLLEVEEHELELVHEPHVQHEILRPNVLLPLGQKVSQREMVGHRCVSVLLGHLDEGGGRLVASPRSTFGRPRADVVEPDAAALSP